MVLFAMQDIPPTGVKLGGWWFNHGGDEQEYFSLAKSIADLDLIQGRQTLGYPLFLAPFIYFTGADNMKDIAKPLFIIQAFILFSLSIILVSLIAEKIFQSRIIGVISGGIFTFFPYLFYFFLYCLGCIYPRFEAYSLIQGPIEFISMNWLLLITDSLSAFLVYFCFYLFLKESDKENPKVSLLILLGILSGFAALVRIANILIIGIFALVWLLRKRIKEFFLVVAVPFFILLPQFIYNQTFFGSPLTFGHRVYSGYSNIFALFSFYRWFGIFEAVYFKAPILIYILPFLVIFLSLGVWRFMKINKIIAIVLLWWFFSFFVFYAAYASYPGEEGYVAFRLFIPIIPPFIFLILASFLHIFKRLKR